MPGGILPDEGIGAQLEYILRVPISGVLPWKLIIWVNDYTPTRTTTLADLVEANWNGYSGVMLDRAEWSVPVVTNGCAKSKWGQGPVSWSVDGGPDQTPYGFAYVDFTAQKVRLVQRFEPEDIVPIVAGTPVRMWPEYTLTSAECG